MLNVPKILNFRQYGFKDIIVGLLLITASLIYFISRGLQLQLFLSSSIFGIYTTIGIKIVLWRIIEYLMIS